MDLHFINSSHVLLLTIIWTIVLSFNCASDVVADSRSRRSTYEPFGHMIDSGWRQGCGGCACREAVTQLTDAVTMYVECASRNALNSTVCQSCVDCYLNTSTLVANTNLSVRMNIYW